MMPAHEAHGAVERSSWMRQLSLRPRAATGGAPAAAARVGVAGSVVDAATATAEEGPVGAAV
jgi:hypothetical protein